jgi:hypothetical protein
MRRLLSWLAAASLFLCWFGTIQAAESPSGLVSGQRSVAQGRISDQFTAENIPANEGVLESRIEQEMAQTLQHLARLREQAERSRAEREAREREQASRAAIDSTLRQVSFQADNPFADEPAMDAVPEEPVHGYFIDESCTASSACGAANYLPGRGLWVRAEYLAWWTKGMSTPPLLTQAPRGNPAILGQGGEVIFGGDDMLDQIRHGGRIRGGLWLDDCRIWGLEGEYLFLGRVADHACEGSGGDDRTVARPFIDAITGRPTTELIGYLPPIGGGLTGSRAVAGIAHVHIDSTFQGAGVRLRHGYSSMFDCAGNGYRFDTLLGYRFLKLDENLSISEDLTSLDPGSPNTAFDIYDRFGTKNEFHGLDLGLLWFGQRDRWSLEVLTKVAIGTNRQEINIDGQTTLTNTANGQSLTSTVSVPADGAGVGEYTGGGLLAQRPNIGRHRNDQFTAVPEIGLTLGYDVNSHVRATFGYSLIVFPQAVRPGDQIDTHVNVGYLPDEVSPLTGPKRPGLLATDTTFWTQGLNAGLEFRW